jgi:hypothetical protein
LAYLDVDGNVISKLMFKKRYGISGTGFFWLITGTRAYYCEHGNGNSYSFQCGTFLDYLKIFLIFKKDFVSWS